MGGCLRYGCLLGLALLFGRSAKAPQPPAEEHQEEEERLASRWYHWVWERRPRGINWRKVGLIVGILVALVALCLAVYYIAKLLERDKVVIYPTVTPTALVVTATASSTPTVTPTSTPTSTPTPFPKPTDIFIPATREPLVKKSTLVPLPPVRGCPRAVGEIAVSFPILPQEQVYGSRGVGCGGSCWLMGEIWKAKPFVRYVVILPPSCGLNLSGFNAAIFRFVGGTRESALSAATAKVAELGPKAGNWPRLVILPDEAAELDLSVVHVFPCGE